MNVTPRQLRIFVYLARTLSFRATAEQFGVTQPTMSKIVQDLELEMGVRLFDRTTRRVKLTREGEELLNIAIRISDDFDEGLSELGQVARRRTRRISVAALPTLTSLLLPGPLTRLRATSPDVMVHVHDVYAEAAIELLRSRSVDIALCSIDTRQEDLHYEAVVEEHFMLMTSRVHHGKLNLNRWDAHGIDGVPIVAMRRGTGTRKCVDDAFRLKGINFRPHVALQHLSSIADFVRGGFGATILPASAIEVLHDDSIVARRIDDVPARSIGIITRKGSRPNQVTRKFIAQMQEGLMKLASSE